MNKNLLKATISLILLFAISTPVTADETTAPFNDTILEAPAYENNNQDAKYYTFEGFISDMREKEGTVSITAEAENGEIYIYHIYENTPVFEQGSMSAVKNTELTVGKEVYVSYPSNTPMALSYPGQISPEVVVIKNTESNTFVKVDKFDKDFLSSDKQLKLNLSEETDIVNLNGDKIDYTELGESTLVVFYTITTRSLPPQTPPQKVIVLKNEKPEIQEPEPAVPDSGVKKEEFIAALSPEQTEQRNGVRYVRLRDAAEAFGYEVSWNETTRTATLTKGSVSYDVTVDQTIYGHNRAAGYFTNAPFILNDRIFVEDDFVTKLML